VFARPRIGGAIDEFGSENLSESRFRQFAKKRRLSQKKPTYLSSHVDNEAHQVFLRDTVPSIRRKCYCFSPDPVLQFEIEFLDFGSDLRSAESGAMRRIYTRDPFGKEPTNIGVIGPVEREIGTDDESEEVMFELVLLGVRSCDGLLEAESGLLRFRSRGRGRRGKLRFRRLILALAEMRLGTLG